MKIKLKDIKKPISQLWCFENRGYNSSIIDKLNSGKQVKVERVPKIAWDYVEEVKIKKTKNENK